MASWIRKNMSVIQRNSVSESGTTVMRKSGLGCLVMSSRLILRMRAMTLVSRNGMKSAGANVNFVVLFFIGRVSADPGARRGKVIIPEHEVGIGSGLDQTLAVESEEARGVERAHGPDLLGRQLQPAQEGDDAAIHGERAAGEKIFRGVPRGDLRRDFHRVTPGSVVSTGGQAGTDVGIGDENDSGPSLGPNGGADGRGMHMHAVSDEVH